MTRGQGKFGVIDAETFERWKPADKQDWMTVMELARHVGRGARWLRKLDRQGQLPKAARFKVGRLSVRLYSPRQQAEILRMFRARDGAKVKSTKTKGRR